MRLQGSDLSPFSSQAPRPSTAVLVGHVELRGTHGLLSLSQVPELQEGTNKYKKKAESLKASFKHRDWLSHCSKEDRKTSTKEKRACPSKTSNITARDSMIYLRVLRHFPTKQKNGHHSLTHPV